MKFPLHYMRTFVPILISGVILYVLFNSIITFTEWSALLKNIDTLQLLAATIMLVAVNALLVIRWHRLLCIAGYTVARKKLFQIFAANLPIAKMSPGYTGDFVRSFFLRKEVPVEPHIGIIGLEALIDIAALAILVIIGALWSSKISYLLVGSAILLGICIAISVIRWIPQYLPKRIADILRTFTLIFQIVSKKPLKLIPILFVSLLAAVLMSIYVYLLFLATGFSTITYLDVLTIQPVVILITLIPISLWGIGVRESAMVVLYTGIAPASVAFSVGMMYSVMGSIILPLLCVPFTYALIKSFWTTRSEQITDTTLPKTGSL